MVLAEPCAGALVGQAGGEGRRHGQEESATPANAGGCLGEPGEGTQLVKMVALPGDLSNADFTENQKVSQSFELGAGLWGKTQTNK